MVSTASFGSHFVTYFIYLFTKIISHPYAFISSEGSSHQLTKQNHILKSTKTNKNISLKQFKPELIYTHKNRKTSMKTWGSSPSAPPFETCLPGRTTATAKQCLLIPAQEAAVRSGRSDRIALSVSFLVQVIHQSFQIHYQT